MMLDHAILGQESLPDDENILMKRKLMVIGLDETPGIA
jgi:hypothetical protein